MKSWVFSLSRKYKVKSKKSSYDKSLRKCGGFLFVGGKEECKSNNLPHFSLYDKFATKGIIPMP